MSKTINKSQFIKLLLNITIFYTIMFPADKLNIKELLFLITVFFGYFGGKIKISKFTVFFGIIFPIFTIIYSLLRGVELNNALSFGYVWFFLLLIPIINKYNYNFTKIFIFATYSIALIIDFIMFADLLGIISLFNNPISMFFQSMNELQLGKGLLATFGYYIFYKSCPLIIITYAIFIYQKKYLTAIPLLISLFACGTRANFLIALFITAVITFMSFKKPIYKITAASVIVLISLILFSSVYNMMSNLNSIKYNYSEAIKVSDTKISFAIITDNNTNLLLGTGVGSSFYSSRGRQMMTFEFSFIDYLRQTGILGISVLLAFFAIILKQIKNKNETWLIVTFLCYLAVAFTNPLLVTSTSFMVYLFVICYVDVTNKLTTKLKKVEI